MEFLLNRYRNLSVLLVAILAQLGLLAYQVRSNQEVRLIRVWAVGAVTPLARVIEAGRSGGFHFFRHGLGAGAAQIGDDDGGAFLRKAAHGGGADASATRSHDSYSTIQFTGHDYPLGKPSTRSPMMLC